MHLVAENVSFPGFGEEVLASDELLSVILACVWQRFQIGATPSSGDVVSVGIWL